MASREKVTDMNLGGGRWWLEWNIGRQDGKRYGAPETTPNGMIGWRGVRVFHLQSKK